MWSLALGNSRQITKRFRMDWIEQPKFDFVLREKDILAEQYTLEVANENGKISYPKSSCFTYDGYIIGEPESLVSLSIRDGFVFGFFKINENHTIFIEPASYYDGALPKDSYVLYNTNDVNWSNPAKCGVKELDATRERLKNNASNRSAGQCRQVQVAIASDQSMLTRYGSATAVENHNIGVMNNVNTDYRNNGQFYDDLEFKIVKQYQSASASTEPLFPVYSGTNSNIVLNNFKNWGNNGNFLVTFDIASFWTTRNLDEDGAGLNPALIGLSYVGTVCGSSNYLVLEDYLGSVNNGSGFGLRVLTSHEIGHSFNCTHDAGGNFVMSPVITNTIDWSQASVSTVNSFVPALPCLTPCSNSGAPVASIKTFNDINCTNTPFLVKDNSENGPTSWTWTAPAAGISPSINSRNISVFFGGPGIYPITLSAENAGGSNSVTQNVSVFNVPTTACVTGTGTLSDAGITYFELGALSKSSGTAAADGGKYIDNICTTNAYLNTSTSYPILLNTIANGFSTMGAKVYIDYNNNGVLNDPGENVKTIPSSFPPGNYNLGSITTPANPVLNTLLRVRVIAGTPGDISSPCVDPLNGQVEDYGIVFTGSLPLELLSLTGRYDKKKVHIHWTTYNEYRTKGFELERSYDGIHFEKRMFVESKGITNYKYDYNVTDENIDCSYKQVYYRLKLLDEDGHFGYSKIIAVHPSCTEGGLEVFPNPFNDELRLHISVKGNDPVELELYDFQGRKVINNFLAPNNTEFGIMTSQLSGGIYWLKLNQDGETLLYQKMIKQ